MKKDLHPTYFPEAKIQCACGNVVVAGGTKKEYRVDICSNCHPFYTGKKELIDTAGRVERFETRRKAKTATPVKEKKVRVKKAAAEKAS